MNSVNRYTWRDFDGPLPGESTWSIVHKFCLRNALSAKVLIEHINEAGRTTKASFTLKSDLRFSEATLHKPFLISPGFTRPLDAMSAHSSISQTLPI